MTGQNIGHYRVTTKLGEGGMGEVYRATDTKLGRDVAIKILPEIFAGDPDRMARFAREAQVLASLNHPHIAAIYGVEDRALVMELVEGETLRGPLPLDAALGHAKQIAEALEAAHDKGIIHRDLKPANIKITPDGAIKVLDFGLAAVAQSHGVHESNPAISPTLTMRATQAGVLLGTPAYMSPEQARGHAVDRRCDIWAFGAVFYEMLTGKPAFHGDTLTDIIAAVVTRDPDWSLLPPGVPPHIVKLLRRCLAKDRRQRLQAIGEARIAIEEPAEAPSSTPPAPVTQRRTGGLAWVVAGVFAAAFAGAGAVAWRALHPEPKPLMRLSVDVGADGAMTRSNGGNMLALSPDGTRLAVTYQAADGKVRLGTRPLHQSRVTPLSGTEDAYYPFFSPDGRWIGFFAGGKLKKTSVDGGAAVTLCDAPLGRGASWGDDGNILAALDGSGPLSRVSDAGGTPAPATKLNQGERTHRWPQVLPGSRAVLFTAHSGAGVYDDANVEVMSLPGGERKTLKRGGFNPRYLASGHLVYAHQSTLFAAPFDIRRLDFAGPPVPVLEDVSSNGGSGGDFAFSQTGTFIYVTGSGTAAGWAISWLDHSGTTKPLHATPAVYLAPSLSPDGKRLAFSIVSGRQEDIWVKDIERDTPSRLTFLPGVNRYPVWTPDGRHMVFRSLNPSGPGLYWVRSDGAGEAIRLTEDKSPVYPFSFSPDGKRLAIVQSGSNGPDILTAPVEGDPERPRLGKPELFVGTPFVEFEPQFSPDGRWLAYTSNESGTQEVYVRPFPGPGGRWQISAGGGITPRWSRNGKELFFQAVDQRLMAVAYTIKGDSFVAEKPTVWSDRRLAVVANSSAYDVAPDGKRVAVFLASGDSGAQKPPMQLTFLLNFFDELRRRAPVK